MGEGEKLVWAAAFVANINYDYPPHIVREDRRGEWEADMIASAVESAAGAVWHLREAPLRVAEGWGKDDEVYMMLSEMLGAE